jgi:peroxiredoxin
MGKNEYRISGDIEGAEGKKVVLEVQQLGVGFTMPRDTAVIKDGHFQFEGKAGEPSVHSLTIEGVQGRVFLVLEPGEIDIKVVKDSMFQNKVTGTYNNDELTAYNEKIMALQEKVRDFEKANKGKMRDAVAKKDNATREKIIADYKALMQKISGETVTMTETYVKEHPKALISLLLVQSFLGAPDADVNKIESFFNGLDQEIKATKTGKLVADKIKERKSVGIGRMAPDFTAPDVNGNPVSLKQSMGKITIVDFWASWCGPCRRENPGMVALYKDYHDLGLNIIGVSLDKTADAWKKAIGSDGLAWTQVSNLKHWEDPIAKVYGVESIPATFVLNQRGVVIAKDLHGAALRAKIDLFLKPKQQTLPPLAHHREPVAKTK